jgi:putative transposase
MGVVISPESRTVELPLVYLMEYDHNVIEFFDQPPSIKLCYDSPSRRSLGVLHTPDFLVIRETGVELVECKPESKLEELAISQPNRYRRDTEGGWICPPGQETVEQYGFTYRVQSDADYNPTLVRNLEFVGDYFDPEYPRLTDEKRRRLKELVQHEPGALMRDLLLRPEAEFLPEDIYRALGRQDLFIDLGDRPISEQNHVRLFLDKAVWEAHQVLVTDDGDANGETNESPSPESKLAQELLMCACPKDLAIANERMRALFPAEGGPNSKSSDRNLSRWRKQYKDAQITMGHGYLGLLPNYNASGNRKQRFPKAVWDLFEISYAEDYATLTQPNKTQAYGKFQLRCKEDGRPAPSYGWYARQLDLKSEETTTLKRQGRRAAYQLQPAIHPDRANGNHGDYPFHVAHIDHTEADIELVDEMTGQNLGRPWLSILIDGYSRRILAFYITFSSPSYVTCMMLLRECVRRHKRLPATLVIDNGKEFHSTSFQTMTSALRVTLRFRPPAQSRFGALVERCFGSLNTQVFNNLAGNTQNMKNVRQVTKSVNPKRHAVWSLERIHDLLSMFCYSIYDEKLHSGVNQSPRDKFEEGLRLGGARETCRVEFDSLFETLTLPYSPRGKGKIVPAKGIKLHHLFYWAEEMRNSEVHRTSVPVRYDPMNAGFIHAYIVGRWVRCRSSHFTTFQNCTVAEAQIAAESMKRRTQVTGNSKAISGNRLAEFLRNASTEEPLLLQRRKDLALMNISSTLRSEDPDPPPGEQNHEVIPAAPTRITPEETEVYDDF